MKKGDPAYRLTAHCLTRAECLSWLLYDFADNSFSVMIVTFVYPVYFKSVVCKGLGNLGGLLWGINGSLSLVVVALLYAQDTLGFMMVELVHLYLALQIFLAGLFLLLRVEEPGRRGELRSW